MTHTKRTGAHGSTTDHGGASATDHTSVAPSRFALAGHPVHPMLIPFPIALLLMAFGADLAFAASADAFFARAALWLAGVGALAALVAATIGLADFLTIERAREHTIGWVHAIGAGTTLTLAAASWLLRVGDPVAAALPWGLVVSSLVAAVLLVTAWAGGDLPYRHLIGVSGHGGDGHGEGAAHKSAPGAATDKGGESAHAGGHDATSGVEGGHGGMGRAAFDPAFAVTRAQLVAVSILTTLALVAGSVFAVSQANLTVSARQVGDVVMPPGMVMRRDLPAEAMRDMAAVDMRAVRVEALLDARGDRSLEARMDGGVKVYELEAAVTRWNILPHIRVAAYAFNGQVPGPRIRITQGDRVRFIVRNSLPEPMTVHWHGLILPNAMDGPAEITQAPIPPGASFTYEFTTQQAGTFFYHSHANPERQQGLGLYGALIIEPRQPQRLQYDRELVVQLQEWLFKNGYTFPSMPMDGMQPNFFTINGKAYPSTETVKLRVGERLLVRFIGSQSGFVHPMHIHGGPFAIVGTDGDPAPEGARVLKDTVNVGPGERYDVIWEAREPGRWLLHCHINHHTTNDNTEEQGAGGLTLILEVE
jgi:FtsP/CotA-like multicopper oxidase with cupredoxin domain/uncharacterized membrane protein